MPRYNYKLSEEKFVNPYTFVPVNFGKKPTEDINTVVENASERLTGVLNCFMYAKTPIAVPDISSVTEENEHSSYRFESTPDGQYMISGSSLRGMIRSVYETATDSCFSTLKENTLLNTRNGDAQRTHSGLLINENGEWKLYEAKRYMLKVAREDNDGKAARRNETEGSTLNPEVWSADCPAYRIRRSKNGTFTKALGREIYSGENVFFVPLVTKGTNIEIWYKKSIRGNEVKCAPVAQGFTKPGAANAHEGYLVLGELISNKHHESIFEKETQKKIPKPVIEKAMEGLEETVKVYRSNVNRMYGDTHYGYPEYENMKKRGCIPVWYIEKGQGVIFSLAAMGRISFQKTLNEHMNQKQPCQSREKMCKACRLFGMAQKDAAVGGRVRFTDAIMQNPEKMSKKMVPLAELGTPRSSYMPFYSNMRDTRDNKGKLLIPSYDDPGITIRGRKYYWHSKDFESINKNAPANGKRNASMQIADTGSEFRFDIYFDRITRQELRELVWTLNFWENKSDGVMCHKIGHGKPVGLGSVKIVVDQITCRSFSEENGYSIIDGTSLIDYSTEEPFADDPRETKFQTITALKKVCNFENAMRTRYPYITNTNNIQAGENDIANHKWFGENKSAGMRGHEDSVQLLPDILKPQELRAYNIEEPGQNVGNNRTYRPRR